MERLSQSQRLDVSVLNQAYPGILAGVEVENGQVMLVTGSGKRFIYDDGRAKDEREALEDPDLEDMLARRTSPGRCARIQRPGIIREEGGSRVFPGGVRA